jgi:hypothetical protein
MVGIAQDTDADLWSEGHVAMTENLMKAFADDIRVRMDDEHLPA